MEGVIVVLAEPGAGKTRLLKSLAKRLGVSSKNATIFSHENSITTTDYLVLDALDEVAKVDPSGIDKLFVKAKETGAKQVVFASRSSEWEKAREVRIRDCFRTEPKVVRLQPFNEDEQKVLFSHQMPGEDFATFKNELNKFDLEPLLGNPQFLQLFADAFVESDRNFTNKRKIFEDAVRRLVHASVSGIAQKDKPTQKKQIVWANEVFAKLLLSGAVGVDVTDTLEDFPFPRLTSLVPGDTNVTSILDTQLFKPQMTRINMSRFTGSWQSSVRPNILRQELIIVQTDFLCGSACLSSHRTRSCAMTCEASWDGWPQSVAKLCKWRQLILILTLFWQMEIHPNFLCLLRKGC